MNGYGRQIDKKTMDVFLKEVYRKSKYISEWTPDNFSAIYRTVLNSADVPKYFGTVYIINLIFFLSKGDLPIYDNFAHKAVKSIFMCKHPSEVYVGPPPECERIEEVTAMYAEYIWLLQKVFGFYSIDRTLDRALWVYGHANEKWNIV